MSNKCVRVRIEGRVQGVWFRGWTRQQAEALGIDGWVRNNADGSVEAVFSGRADDVDDMLKLCWQGPPLARVDTVTESAEPSVPQKGFHQTASTD